MICAARAGDLPSIRGELASAETAIAVEAGEHAPRLTTLSLRGGTIWKNRVDETLPGYLEIDGSTQPLAWRLDRSASLVCIVPDSPGLPLRFNRCKTGVAPVLSRIGSLSVLTLHRRDAWLGDATGGASSFPQADGERLPANRIFLAALTSLSCMPPHAPHTHVLTSSMSRPLGPVKARQLLHARVVFFSLTMIMLLPACSPV